MSTRKILTTMSFAALFAGAAMAAEPTITLESIENKESFDVTSEEYVQASGAYYRDGGSPDGKLHRGPVVNVGSMSIDGTFEVKASDQDANRLFDVRNVSGAGEIRFGRGVYISQESNFSNFSGTLTLFTAVNDQGNRKGSGAYFLSGTNNPSNINAFNLEKNTELSFTNGNYTLNGKIEGAGTISARTLGNLNFEIDKILENAAPANVAIKGDISEFSGGYAASGNSTIRLETTLADSVKFSGSQGGSLELVGGAGDAKKTVTVSSGTNTTTSGNVYMYGNKAVIAQNSNDAGTLGANGGTIYFGGKNGYSTAEKVSHTFDTTTVRGNTAGNVVVGGKGTGASMEAGADIVVDGVKIDSLVAGGAEGASVNGDINVTVKSGTVASLSGGKGGIHTGNTNITVENGSVANIYGGDQHGGQIKGDISVNVKDGTVGTIYGANYVSTSEKASDFNGVNGNVKIDVSGGTVNHIRGGINSTNAGDAATAKSKMVLNGNVEVNVSGNAHIGAADGESILATGGSYGSVNGNTTINISDNAVVEGIVAGGASRTDDKGVKSTYINVKGGTLNGDIYGGGLKYSTVTENTNVNISGGTVNANVYGGGATETTIVNGNANVNITGGTVAGSVYGAGNSDLIKGNTNVKMTSGTIGDNSSVVKHVAIYGGGEKGTIIEGSTKVEVSGGSMLANYESGNGVYGAGTENTVKGNTEVIISGGSLNNYTNVQGSDRLSLYNRVAGAGVGGVVEGNSSITIRGGENIVNVMGAGVGATVKGNTNVTIDGASVGDVMGGNIFARSGKVWEKDYTGGEVLGTANVEIKNGATVGMVIGGNSSGVTVGSTNVTISDSTVKNNVVGGNSVISGPVKSSYIAGGTVVNVENSTINGDIRGGNNTSNSDLFNGDFSSFKVSSVDINVTGNSTVGNGLESIRGAGGSYASVEGAVNIDLSGNSIFNGTILAGSSGNGTSVGSTNIKISDNVVVNGNVYGGGKNGGVVNGNTNVTLSGNASIKGTLNGGGVNGTTIVEGKKVLNLGTVDAAYKGTSALKIADFDTINVAKGTTASVEKIEQNLTGAVAGSRTFVNEGANFTVEGDIVNTLENATNNGSFVAGLTSVKGDLQSGGSAIVKGTVKTVINGADTKLKYFYGGNGGNQKGSDPNFRAIMDSRVGAVDVTVNDGSIDMIVGNGAMLSDVNGNVGITVNGGTIGGIYGAGSNGLIGGDVNITVNGGTFKGDQSGAYTIAIAAGGANNANDSIDVSTISGSTNVVIGGDAKLNGDVFGGGWGGYTGKKQGGVINGGTNITLKDNATILGTIYGGGIAGNTVINGKKTLNIGTADAAYNGASALKVADFQKIGIVNGSAEFASYTQAAEGTLIKVFEKGKLAMSLNSESQFSDTSLENAGEVAFKRGRLADNASVTLKSYNGSGKVSAFGGTFADGVFTAGKSESFESSAITVGTGANDVQTVKFGDKLALDFDVAGLGESALTVNEIKESTDLNGIAGNVLAAYDVDLTDNSNDYTVVFSAYVGEIEAADALVAWHKGKDGVWTRLDTSIDYADKIASIVVDGFSSYAFSQVPEPATYAAIFGALALAFAAYRRRK